MAAMYLPNRFTCLIKCPSDDTYNDVDLRLTTKLVTSNSCHQCHAINSDARIG